MNKPTKSGLYRVVNNNKDEIIDAVIYYNELTKQIKIITITKISSVAYEKAGEFYPLARFMCFNDEFYYIDSELAKILYT
jgi:hypothetical protein